MKWFDLILHTMSLTFAILCVTLTALGVWSTYELGQYLKMSWGVAAFILSCWLSKQLSQHVVDKLENV